MKNRILFFFLFLSTFLSGQSKMTTFDVNKHGFRFSNRFVTTAGDAGFIKIDFGGLCGGMSYAAADYFYARKSAPSQEYRPQIGSRLHEYIKTRQLNSFKSMDKWTELVLGGDLRAEEFFYWGLEGRLYQLKRAIDRNRPTPLGLLTAKNDIFKNHQVLAVGYDLGGYKNKRDKDPNKNRVRIFIYDPNHPKTLCVLIPDADRKWYRQYKVKWKRGIPYTGDRIDKEWRTYFIDENYTKSFPPRIYTPRKTDSKLVKKLLVDIKTGSDDLRGGNDNVDIIVSLKGGKKKRFNCANRKHRWPDNLLQTVEVRLDRAVPVSDILGVELRTTFRGGMGGDNWNVNYLCVQAVKGNGQIQTILERQGTPLKRFTGDRKSYYTKTIFGK